MSCANYTWDFANDFFSSGSRVKMIIRYPSKSLASHQCPQQEQLVETAELW